MPVVDNAEKILQYLFIETFTSLITAVLLIVACWKIFEKAGEHGWAALIPFYNTYVEFKIAYGNGWKMFLLLIPFVNIVIAIQSRFKLSKAFGQSTAFGFGLLFLPTIFRLVLAFKEDARYVGVQ